VESDVQEQRSRGLSEQVAKKQVDRAGAKQ
jgi:hypothetical protein